MLRLLPLALVLSVLALSGCGSDEDEAGSSTTAPADTQAAHASGRDALRTGVAPCPGRRGTEGTA